MSDPLNRIEDINYFELADAVSKRIKVIKDKIRNLKVEYAYTVSENIKLVWKKNGLAWNIYYMNNESEICKPLDQCKAFDRSLVGLKNLDDFVNGFADNLEKIKESVNYNM